MAENMIVEILDGDKPCEANKVGEIVVTELNNYVMPLIRYRTGDYASFSAKACECGRTLLVISNLFGRAYDTMRNREGKLKRQLVGLLIGMIDTVHSVSIDAQENLLANFPSLRRRKGKCIVIPNGIEVERFEVASPRDLRGELGVGENVLLIGFLGRFMAQKGVRQLVDAIEVLQVHKGLPKKIPGFGFG